VEDVQLLTYPDRALPSLAGVYSCWDDEGCVEIQFDLQAKRAGTPHIIESSKNCCCFCEPCVANSTKVLF